MLQFYIIILHNSKKKFERDISLSHVKEGNMNTVEKIDVFWIIT